MKDLLIGFVQQLRCLIVWIYWMKHQMERSMLKDVSLIKAMGAYVYKLYIGKTDYFANFADAIPKAGKGIDGGMIYRYGKYVSDSYDDEVRKLL